MISLEDLHFLSFDEAKNISSYIEREFALRCLAVGCLVVHQVPVGKSLIDFLVINPKVTKGSLELLPPQGTLVEITFLSRSDKDKRIRDKQFKGKKRKVLNTTGLRKARQIEAMQASGYRWTILFRENFEKMMVPKINGAY